MEFSEKSYPEKYPIFFHRQKPDKSPCYQQELILKKWLHKRLYEFLHSFGRLYYNYFYSFKTYLFLFLFCLPRRPKGSYHENYL